MGATTIAPVAVRPGGRVLAMSDLHGHAENFLRALGAAGYGADDVLVIAGDLVDKGPESLRTVRCVMRLAAARPVFVSMGNVDAHRIGVLLDETEGGGARFAEVVHSLRAAWGCGLLLDLLREAGVDEAQVTAERAPRMQALLRARFAPELAFLRSRPTILTMGRYLFVHGGVPTDDVEALVGTDDAPWLKNDSFYTQGRRFARCVCVGHWPVNLYRADREELNPLIDPDRNIVCMDGGCGLKAAGQINVLMIPGPHAPPGAITYTAADSLPRVTAHESQPAAPASVHIHYLDCAVEPLEERGGMTRCRRLSDGRVAEIPTQLLWRRGRGWCASDYVDARLAVHPGDVLGVVCRVPHGLFCKKDGVLGWYFGAFSQAPLPKAPPLKAFL